MKRKLIIVLLIVLVLLIFAFSILYTNKTFFKTTVFTNDNFIANNANPQDLSYGGVDGLGGGLYIQGNNNQILNYKK